MTGQHWISSRKLFCKCWRFKSSEFGKSEVSTTPSHTFFFEKFLPSEDLSERESLRLVPRDSNPINATNKIYVPVLHVRFSTRLCLAHNTSFNWTSHRTLSASFSSNIRFEGIKKEIRISNWSNWFNVCLWWIDVFRQSDTLLRHLFHLIHFRRTWFIIGGFIFLFEYVLNFQFRNDRVVCQKWGCQYSLRIGWGTQLNILLS